MGTHDKWHYLLLLFISAAGSYLLALLLPLIHTLIPTFQSWYMYLVIGLSGFAIGYICAHEISRVTHREKNELLAGIIIPLPAMIIIYGVLELINHVNSSLDAIAQQSFFLPVVIGPVLSAAVYFVAFSVPFLYHFRHKDMRMYSYYIIAPIVFVVAVVVINVLLEFV